MTVVANLREAWLSAEHVGDTQPTCRIYVRQGRLQRRMRTMVDPPSFVPGLGQRRVWKGRWVPLSDYMRVPNVNSCEIEQNFDQNGSALTTITIDNIAMVEETGPLSDVFHSIQRGYYSPFRGYKPPKRLRVKSKNDWFDVLRSKSSQITVLEGYGEFVVPVFTGLINTCDLASRPDILTITARDMLQFVTDQRVFEWAKHGKVRDPITFADRLRSDDTKQVGGGARAKSSRPGHPPRFVLDFKDRTNWQSDGHDTPDGHEWIEIDVPAGRYENINLKPEFAGLEMYISVYARDHGAPGGRGATRNYRQKLPQGWIDEDRGNVPTVGIPYVHHVKRVSRKNRNYSLPASYVLGDNSKIRLTFTNLAKTNDGKRRVRRAGLKRFHAVKRRRPHEVEKNRWILVDDASDIIKTVLLWCGITDWDIEETGVRLKDHLVFNRGDYLIDIVKKIAEMTNYVFFMKPPDSFDEDDLTKENLNNLSMGVAVFRYNQAAKRRPLERIETITERNLLTGIDVRFDDEPLAQVIRVRGKTVGKKKGGVFLGGDRTRRYMYVYRPVWARRDDHFNGGVIKHVVHHDQMIASVNECKVACLFIAFREALESVKGTVQAPGMPTICLDSWVSIYDTGTGMSTRMWVVSKNSTFTSGEDGGYTMSLSGSMLDAPDIVETRAELEAVLDDEGFAPGPLSGKNIPIP